MSLTDAPGPDRGYICGMNIPVESRAAFIVCTFSMLGKIAAVDGNITSDEVARIERYIDRELKLDNEHRALAIRVLNESFTSPLELRDYAEKFNTTFRDRVQLPDGIITVLLELSAVDGVVLPEEEQLVRSAALLLGLSIPAYERIKEKVGLTAPHQM